MSCDSTQFVCANGGCVQSSYWCNGQSECSDGSDEQGCAVTDGNIVSVDTNTDPKGLCEFYKYKVILNN